MYKNIFTNGFLCFIYMFLYFKNYAQCSATIIGTPCVRNTLTARVVGTEPDTLFWAKNKVIQCVKTKRNPVSTIAAGGGVAAPQKLNEPQDVFVDPNGVIYVISDGVNSVQKWLPGATSGITVAGGNGKGTALNQFFSPKGIFVDKLGNVYVSDALMNRVTKWVPGATSGVVVAGGNGEGNAANQFSGNQNICLDTFGNIYVADRWNNRVQKWTPGATTGITVAGGNGSGSALNQLIEPLDVDVDLASNVYVVDYYNNRVVKWMPGAITGIVVAGGNGSGSAANQFNFTTALSITKDGSLYVRDQSNYRIQKWKPGAAYGVTVAGGNGYALSANNVGPGFGLFADENDNVYVPELFGYAVNKFSKASTVDSLYIPAKAGNYILTAKSISGCQSNSPLLSIMTTPPKPIYINGLGFVSNGQANITYDAKAKIGSTYTWSVPFDANIIGGQGTNSIMVNWGASNGQVAVFETNACGVSKVTTKDVYISNPISYSVQ